MEKTYRYLVVGDVVQSGDQRQHFANRTWSNQVLVGRVITKFYADRQYYRREVVVVEDPQEAQPYKAHYIFLDPTDIIQKGDEALTPINPNIPYVTHILNGTSWQPCPEFLSGYTQRYSGDIVRRKVDYSGPATA